MSAKLIDLQTGEAVPVEHACFRIGREKSYVDYAIDHGAVSRSHCNLLQKDGRWYVVDCHSANFTCINGGRILPDQEVALRHGDELMIADLRYRFAITEDGEVG